LDQHHSEDEEEISEKSSSLDREEKAFDKRTMSNGSVTNHSFPLLVVKIDRLQ